MELFPASRQIGDTVYLSGQVPDAVDRGPTSTVETQTRAAFAKVREALGTHGLNMDAVRYVTCYLRDASDFAEYNTVWQETFPEERPARTTVGAEIFADGVRVELTVVASRGRESRPADAVSTPVAVSGAERPRRAEQGFDQ